MTNYRAESGPYFGEFGGRFVPESLIAALDELSSAYELTKTDPAFAAELAELQAALQAIHIEGERPPPPVLSAAGVEASAKP